MASVQYLFTCSRTFNSELVTAQRHFEEIVNYRASYVVRIQAAWRGYAAFKKYKRICKAIRTIQSYYRGWKVRKNKKAHAAQYIANQADIKKRKAAIKIQAWWRGTIARKYMRKHNRLPTDRIKEQNRIQQINDDMAAQIRHIFRINQEKEEESKQRQHQREALYILYKCHHMLRTYATEGIYSCHGSRELSLIEILMQSLPCRDYMDNLHRLYEELVKMDSKPKYKFKRKAFRNLEDAIRHCIENEEKEVKQDYDYWYKHPKPFKLSPKVDKKPYVPGVFIGPHMKMPKKPVDPKLLELEKKFKLYGRDLDLKNRDVPYYIDYWEKDVFGRSSASKNIC